MNITALNEPMIAVNQTGLLYVTHAALPHLLGTAEDELRSVADIVNISSIAGRQAWANFGVYADQVRRERLHRSASSGGHEEACARRRAHPPAPVLRGRAVGHAHLTTMPTASGAARTA